MNKKGQIATILVVGLILIVLAVLIYFLLNGFNFSVGYVTKDYDNNRNNNYVSCRTIMEPYEKSVPYTEQVPYTDRDCFSDTYSSRAGYIVDGDKTSWSGKINLYDGSEAISGSRDYYITNNEDESGRFDIIVNYYDEFGRKIDSYTYDRVTVQDDDTEEGTIHFSDIFDNKPSKAKSFNLELDAPNLQVCEGTTRYRTVVNTRTVIDYRARQVCD